MPIACNQFARAFQRLPAAELRGMSLSEHARAWGYAGAEEKKRRKEEKLAKADKASLAAGERGERGGQLRLSFGGTLGLSGGAKRARTGPAPTDSAVGGAQLSAPAATPATADSLAAAAAGAGSGSAAPAAAAGAGAAAAPAPERTPSENGTPVIIELLDDEPAPPEQTPSQPQAQQQQQRRVTQEGEALPAWAEVRAAGKPCASARLADLHATQGWSDDDDDGSDWALSDSGESEAGSDLEDAENTAALRAGVKKKRTYYTAAQKLTALRLCMELNGSVRRAVVVLRRTGGWGEICRRTLRRWLVEACTATAAPRSVGGKPVNEAFETAVMDRMIFSVVKNVDGEAKAMQLANVAHSYGIITAAAADAQKEVPWCNDANIRSLQFSNKWVGGFLRRWQLRRRKITAVVKARPSVEEVCTRLSAIQLVIESKKLTADDIINADETGINRGLNPTHAYVPDGAERAAAPASDEKARFTSMEAGTAAGNMLPQFEIIECTLAEIVCGFVHLKQFLRIVKPNFSFS